MISKLLIITTGGTIDKIYFDDKSDYQIGEPQISQILHAMHVAFDFEVSALMRKDSLHLDDGDRRLIRDAVAASDTDHVLITHGTDTMVETAMLLQEIQGKSIVLTGALNPARFRGFRRRVQHRLRCRRRPKPCPRRLHRDERQSLGSRKSLQKPPPKPLRTPVGGL